MSIINDQQLVRRLQDARDELYAEFEQWEASLTGTRVQYETRISGLEQAIAAFNSGDSPSSNGNGDHDKLAIGPDKLEAVRTYMSKRGKTRQADIAKHTRLNSGTVSVALRLLEAAGEVSSGPKEDGSRTWEFVQVPVAA
jgi:hypothetical protein